MSRAPLAQRLAQRHETATVLNRAGAPAHNALDTLHDSGARFYCGASNVKLARPAGKRKACSNCGKTGTCGPSSGCQCIDCRALQVRGA